MDSDPQHCSVDPDLNLYILPDKRQSIFHENINVIIVPLYLCIRISTDCFPFGLAGSFGDFSGDLDGDRSGGLADLPGFSGDLDIRTGSGWGRSSSSWRFSIISTLSSSYSSILTLELYYSTAISNCLLKPLQIVSVPSRSRGRLKSSQLRIPASLFFNLK